MRKNSKPRTKSYSDLVLPLKFNVQPNGEYIAYTYSQAHNKTLVVLMYDWVQKILDVWIKPTENYYLYNLQFFRKGLGYHVNLPYDVGKHLLGKEGHHLSYYKDPGTGKGTFRLYELPKLVESEYYIEMSKDFRGFLTFIDKKICNELSYYIGHPKYPTPGSFYRKVIVPGVRREQNLAYAKRFYVGQRSDEDFEALRQMFLASLNQIEQATRITSNLPTVKDTPDKRDWVTIEREHELEIAKKVGNEALTEFLHKHKDELKIAPPKTTSRRRRKLSRV